MNAINAAAKSWIVTSTKARLAEDMSGNISSYNNGADNMQAISEACGDYAPAMIHALVMIAEDDMDTAIKAARDWDESIAELVRNADARDYRDIDGKHCRAVGDEDLPLPGVYTIGIDGHADEDDEYAEWLAAQPGVTVNRGREALDRYFELANAAACNRAWAAYCAA